MMVDDRFVVYFKKWRDKGYSEEQIAKFLVQTGYPENVVNEAMASSRVISNPITPSKVSSEFFLPEKFRKTVAFAVVILAVSFLIILANIIVDKDRNILIDANESLASIFTDANTLIPIIATEVSDVDSVINVTNSANTSLPSNITNNTRITYSSGGGSSGGSSSRGSSSSSSDDNSISNEEEFSVLTVAFEDGPNELPTRLSLPPKLDSIRENISVSHERFPAFASPESRIYSQEGLIAIIADTVTYRQAYYSLDGNTWNGLNLTGNAYEGHDGWILGDAVFRYPDSFSNTEENYIAIYSCYKEYTWLDVPWNCHGEWQIIVVENGLTDATDPYAKVRIDDADFTCGNQHDYQCDVKTICGEVKNFGSCSSGYYCSNNLCIASENKSCDDIVCNSEEYCSRGVCLLNVSGNTYFVALWGNDSWPGNFTHPFYSWQKSAEIARPGDMIYIRGGVWYPTKYIGYSSTIGMIIDPTGYTSGLYGGTENAPIRYFNYPGEKPIIDGSLITTSSTRWLGGISLGRVEYVYLKGLTVRHIHQSPPDFNHVKSYSEVGGIGSGGANIHFENMVVHDIDGRGFQHWSTAWRVEDAQSSYDSCVERNNGDNSSCTFQTPPFESDNSSWINCDAYNLFDRYASEPGNAADGWKVGTYYGSTFTWKGCRAWNYSDDGFDPHGAGLRIFDTCWASSMGSFVDITPMWGTEGNGFKNTGPEGVDIPSDEHNVIFKNCIAAANPGAGFITNLLTSVEYSSNPLELNNLAYDNGYAYWGLRGGVVRNNIAYGTRNIGPIGEIYNIAGDNFYLNTSFYTESNNTWYKSPSLGWPPSYINPAYNVTNDDFVSLDILQLTRPRKSDGSLPDITFGHLAEGSDLIDAGIIVPGYHCDTSGAHPGENCREWYGAAPDLGPFEYIP
jgi:hypothetical protein